MIKYDIFKLIKVKKPFTDKYYFRKEKVYPYGIGNLGNAKACARIVSASINYNDKNNRIVNVIVQDKNGNMVFVARNNIDGIPGKYME